MDKKNVLNEIFADDPFNLLDIKPKVSQSRNEEERLISSFEEINSFFEKEQREPTESQNMQERTLFSRLTALRINPSKILSLKPYDKFDLLKVEAEKEYNTLEDLLQDDFLGLLSDDREGLFDLKHVDYSEERASADFVARRKPCKDFDRYEQQFKSVQSDLKIGNRKLVAFKEENLRAGDFYIHNGILLFLEKVEDKKEVQEYKSGSRERKDGRTRVLFENGTESNMLYRSLYKALLANGKAVSKNSNEVASSLTSEINTVNEEDIASGHIYILQSKSTEPRIKNLKYLYKIGFSSTEVSERIKNAKNEPTYLMADVHLVTKYLCYNMNSKKLESLLHNFFGSACLDIDIFDNQGQRHSPREWFVAPLDVIEKAVDLIIKGDITKYKFDLINNEIVSK